MIGARRQVAAAALVLAAAAAAPAGATTAEDTFSSIAPVTATGIHVRINYESRDANGQPRPLHKHTFTFPPGTVFDSAGAGVCQASAAELQSQGLGACPADSRVGGGSLEAVATRPPGSLGPPVDTQLTIFNTSRPKDAPNVTSGLIVAISLAGSVRTVFVAPIEGNVVTENPPPVCSTPGEHPPCPSGELTVNSVDYTIDPRSRDVAGQVHRLITTPPACPAAATWGFDHLMEYRDGATASASSTTSCVPGAVPRLSLRVTPASTRRCRATRFVFTAVTSDGPVAGATVRFANRRALTDGQGRAAIPARVCVPGQRRATVKADGFRKGAANVRVLP